jgi:hypothetical protein
MKIEIAKMIFKLIASICKDNKENQTATYNLKENFLDQASYFKEASDCIISVCGNNENILNKKIS